MGNENPETEIDARPGVNWSFREVTEFVRACYDRDMILDVLMGYSAHWFPARMTLVVGRSWVQLFAAAGFDLPEALDKSLRRADVADGAPAVSEAEAVGTPDDIGLEKLFSQLSLDVERVKTLGITIGGRIAIVIVGELQADDVDTSNFTDAAEVAGVQLEQVIRMTKSGSLPPKEERVPEFPRVGELGRDPTKKAPTVEPSARETQRLDHNRPGGVSETVSGPRFAPAEDVDDSEAMDDILDRPSEKIGQTSFGLPFATRVKAPSDEELALLTATLTRGAYTRDEGELSDENSDAPEDVSVEEAKGEPQAEVSEPPRPEAPAVPAIEDDMFGDFSFGEALDAAADEAGSEGVSVMAPREIGDETSRTQLGGILAQTPALGHETDSSASAGSEGENDSITRTRARALSFRDEDDEDGDDNLSYRPPGSSGAAAPTKTAMGGVEGETRLVTESLHRSRLEEFREKSRSEDSQAEETPEVAEAPEKSGEASGAWVNPTKDGPPAAMILRRAKRSKKKSGRAEKSTPMPVGSREPRATGDERPFSEASDSKPVEARSRMATPVHGIGTEPRSGRGGPPASMPAPDPDNDETKLPWSRDEKTKRAQEPLKASKSEAKKDEWFDYFAEEALDSTSRREAVDPNMFSVSEPEDRDPQSLPPETLDRLLESGPHMVDMQEAFLLLDSRDRERAFDAANEIAERGGATLEVLNLMFPGRIFLDRYQYVDDMPPVNEHGPLLHALVRIGGPAIDIARRHLNDSSNETRFYAVFLFTRLDAGAALDELFARLFDRDTQIRKFAADILFGYQNTPEFAGAVREPLRAELRSEEDAHVDVAAKLIGRLRDVDAIVALIDTLDEVDSPKVKASAMAALKQVTLHAWSSPYEWRKWWEKAQDQSRTYWVSEALDAASDELRQLAFEEVQRIPGLELNYHPDQPQKLRQRAQKELRSWLTLHEK